MRALLLLPALAFLHACTAGDDGPKDDADTDADRPVIDGRPVLSVISSGSEHTCLLVDGDARCWGHNGLGEALSHEGPFTSVSVGSQFNCGLAADGSVACWGVSGDDRLVVPSGVNFSDLDVGTSHTCGLTQAGELRCWGKAASTDLRPPMGKFLDVESGNDLSCALDTTGKPTCWGSSSALDDVPSGAFDLIRLGTTEACALTPDGALSCWGGGPVSFDAPASGAFADVVVGDSAACAIQAADGALVCWGGAGAGFGNEIVSDVPGGAFTQVSVGTGHACALGDSGPVCWGADTYGAATVPFNGSRGVFAATSAACSVNTDETLSCFGLHGAFDTLDGKKWRSVELHSADACAVSSTGAATCGLGAVRQFTFTGSTWKDAVDYGTAGYCGLSVAGAVTCYARNGSEIPGLEGTYADITTGQDGICGLTTDGQVSCIGDANNSRPVETYTALAMGGFSCVLDADGKVSCWGDDAPAGGVPDGTYTAVTVGGTFACAIRADENTLACWGDDDLVVSPTHTYGSVDADGSSVCAVRLDGQVECFGDMTRVALDGTVGGS